MRTVIMRLLTLRAENVTPEVLMALGFIYLGAVALCLSSVFRSTSSSVSRLAWMMLVIFLPVIGIFLYCFRCLILADYSALKQVGILNPKKITLVNSGQAVKRMK